MEFYVILIALFLLVVVPWMARVRKLAAVTRILNRKRQNKEKNIMKELAQKFVDKECVLYTVANEYVKGTVKEVTDSGVLVECEGELQAVNLEFVTRIREWPRKKNGKKKEVILD